MGAAASTSLQNRLITECGERSHPIFVAPVVGYDLQIDDRAIFGIHGKSLGYKVSSFRQELSQ